MAEITVSEIIEIINNLGGYHSILIPEFTYTDLRIDALVIDFRHRWIRGFEIKTNRADFLKDTKWTRYSEFCSSLSIVCPSELIQKDEIQKPFGLLWVSNNNERFKWIKRPKNFQDRNSLSWLYTYVAVIEKELPRISGELNQIKNTLKYYKELKEKGF